MDARSYDERAARLGPNAADRARARRLGVESPGGAIGIHGTKKISAGVARAWLTMAKALCIASGPPDGCIAVELELVYDAVDVGTPITILP